MSPLQSIVLLKIFLLRKVKNIKGQFGESGASKTFEGLRKQKDHLKQISCDVFRIFYLFILTKQLCVC